MSRIIIEKKNIFSTIGLYLGFIAMAFFPGCVGATLPALADNTTSGVDEISILFSTLFLGYIIGSFFSGKLHDKFNPFRVIGCSLLLGAAALLIIPTLDQRWVLAGIVLLLGLAQGSVDLGTNMTLIWIHGDRSIQFLNGLHAFFGLGAFLTPLLIGKVVTLTGGIHWAYWILAMIVLPIALFLIFLHRPAAKTPKTDSQSSPEPGSRRPPFIYILLFSLLLLTVIGCGNSFSGWILTYTQSMFPDLAPQTAYQISSTFWIAIALTRVLTIPIIARIPSKRILLIDIIGFSASFGLMLVFRQSFILLWLTVASAGMAVATVFAAILVYCNRVCGMRGSSTRWLYLGAGLGNVTIPWLVGQFFEHRGPFWMHIVHIFFILIGLILLFILTILTRKKPALSGEIHES